MTLRTMMLGLAFLASPLAAQAQTASFRIEGLVQHPQTYTLSTLSSLPQTRLNVDFYTGSGPVTASYTGVLLWDLLNAAGVITDPSNKNDLLRRVVAVVGSDGYVAVYSLGELAPQFGGEQVIVAYAVNGAPLAGASGFAETIAPGDKAGGRAVNRIAHIIVL